MATSEHDRLQLFDRLRDTLGTDEAGILMELLPPVGWADIATNASVQAQGAALRGEMAGLGAELRVEMAGLRTDMQREMGELRTDFVGVRGEFSELRGEIAQSMARQTRTLVFAFAGFATSIWITLLVA